MRLSQRMLFPCTAALTRELLQVVPMGQPDKEVLDYWATLSSCLTDLDITVDPIYKRRLEPGFLKNSQG